MADGRSSPAAALRDRTVQAVFAIATLGLVARFVALHARVAHQDEARVAYWVTRFAESGVFEYRPIIHGPFLPVVDHWVIVLLGPSDVTTRGVVAVIGAALPLVALLFREHLRDSEVVGLAALLAANPVLLYYSRFFRSDIVVATFMLLALGLFVRTYDTRQSRYLYVGVAAFAMAFSAKENALVYPVCWLGALVLLFDHRLFVARVRERTPTAVAKAYGWAGLKGLWRWRVPLVVAGVEFVAVIVFFYAPRGGGYGGAPGVGLWSSLETLAFHLNPGPFTTVVEEGSIGALDTFLNSRWAGTAEHPYLPFLKDYLRTMEAGALTLSALAVVGFLQDRYSHEGPRDLVSLAFYWGFVSVLGYPLATDIQAPWATVHAIVPLAIPAAVGLGLIYRWGVEAFTDDDGVGVAIAAVLLLLLGMQVGMAAYGNVYATPADRDNELVQYAQSSTPGLKPMLTETVGEIALENEGTDVLYYGTEFNSNDESAAKTPARSGGGWFARLPMAWYLEAQQYRHGDDVVTVNSTADPREIQETNRSALPPVVISLANTSYYGNKDTEDEIIGSLQGYTRYTYQRYLWSSEFVVFVRNDWERYASVESGVTRINDSDGGGGDGIIDPLLPGNQTNTTDDGFERGALAAPHAAVAAPAHESGTGVPAVRVRARATRAW
jgi:uncharacterized protein (TIGR03663 family)